MWYLNYIKDGGEGLFGCFSLNIYIFLCSWVRIESIESEAI